MIKFIKEHILGSLIVGLLVPTLIGIWKLVFLVHDVPDKIEETMKEISAIQQQINELREADKSLNRRVTNNQTEIFYLIMGKKREPQKE